MGNDLFDDRKSNFERHNVMEGEMNKKDLIN